MQASIHRDINPGLISLYHRSILFMKKLPILPKNIRKNPMGIGHIPKITKKKPVPFSSHLKPDLNFTVITFYPFPHTDAHFNAIAADDF